MMAFTPSGTQFLSNQPQLGQKRQSRPSQFASSIQNFKQTSLGIPQQYDKATRKPKTNNNTLEDTFIDYTSINNNQVGSLKCVLPSGRKINVSLLVKRRGSRRMRRLSSYRKVSEKESVEIVNKSPPAQKPPLDLLSKFLLVAEELNKMEQEQKEKIGQEREEDQDNHENQNRRRSRVRNDRDEDQKIIRHIERVNSLSQRLQTIIDDFIYL